MNSEIFLTLIQNVALLLAMALIFDLATLRWRTGQAWFRKIVTGLILGFIGIALILTPWKLTQGIIFDTRSVLLGISGLFFGLIPTVIAILITAAYRLNLGGEGVLMGILVILTTGSIGILWRRLRKAPLADISMRDLYLFGLVIHLVMLACAFVMPFQTALHVLRDIGLPVLLIYPIATTLLGVLMANRLKRERTTQELKDNKEQLDLAVKASNIGFFDYNILTGAAHFSPEWKNQIGYAPGEFRNDRDEWESRVHPEDFPGTIDRVNACIEGLTDTYEAEYRLRHKDGTYRRILARGLLQRNAQGKPALLVGCHVDITQREKNEEAILASERRFRGLAESSQDYIMLYDREYRHVYENPAALRVAGLTAEDIIGKTHREAGFSDKLSEMWEADIRRVFSSKATTQRLFEWDGVDGKMFLDWRLSPVFGPDGQVELVLGISRDITALKQVEAQREAALVALRANETKYRIVADNTYDWEYWRDTQNRFVYCSPSCKQITGYDPGDFMRDPSLMNEIVLPEDRQLLDEHVCTTDGGEINQIEFRIRWPDGTIHWLGHVCQPVYNNDGQFLGTRGSNRDITQRKLAEFERERALAALKSSEENYRQLFELAADGIFIRDPLGNYVDVNPSGCALLGYSRDEILHHNLRDLMEVEEPQTAPHPGSSMREGVNYVSEQRMRRKDGSFIDVEVSGRRLPDGRVQDLVRDITTRKRMDEKVNASQIELQQSLHTAEQSRRALLSVIEDQKQAEEQIRRLNAELEERVSDRTAQLETANKELEAFAYSVSHDLRAPLRAMDGFSAALLSGYADRLDEQGQHYLNRVQEASRRMSRLINDLLNLSRVTRRELTRQTVDLSELAREVARDLRSPTTARLVEFDITPGIIAQADPHLLKIALENLMNNAYKFTSKREPARIHFGAADQDGELVYFVRDNGVGFNMEYATKLFAPFQRLHGMQEYPGTGIGLVTVQRIIHRHGGRIWPEAELDQGATFYFTLGGPK